MTMTEIASGYIPRKQLAIELGERVQGQAIQRTYFDGLGAGRARATGDTGRS